MADETKTCECSARNALDGIAAEVEQYIKPGEQNTLLCDVVQDARAALQLPCPCAGLREEIERQRQVIARLSAPGVERAPWFYAPCPSCGAIEGMGLVTARVDGVLVKDHISVWCANCEHCGPGTPKQGSVKDTDRAAVIAWNREFREARVEHDSLRADLAAKQRAYDQICEQCASAERALNEEQKSNDSLRADSMVAHHWFAKHFGDVMNGRDFAIKCSMASRGLAEAQERERKLRSDLHAQCGRVLDLEREARNSDYSVKKELDALVKQREEAHERERVLRTILVDVQDEFRLLRMKDTATVYDPTLRSRIALALATPEGTRDE